MAKTAHPHTFWGARVRNCQSQNENRPVCSYVWILELNMRMHVVNALNNRSDYEVHCVMNGMISFSPSLSLRTIFYGFGWPIIWKYDLRIHTISWFFAYVSVQLYVCVHRANIYRSIYRLFNALAKHKTTTRCFVVKFKVQTGTCISHSNANQCRIC